MACNIKVIRNQEHKTSEWSGGTTTQLYIYPEESIYSELDFTWRLSSARVDIEESTFTHLPGIDRKIMILDGKLILEHQGKYITELNEFDIDSFSGNWTTKSYGKVTDFNLMMSKECTGDLEYIRVKSDSFKEIKLINKQQIYNNIADVLYCISGEITVKLDSEIDIYKGDLFVLTRERDDDVKNLNIFNKSKDLTKIIRSTIYY